MHQWGASPDEISATYPGDELVPAPGNVSTRAVTVHAPASAVWPWLQQIDQQRGGFYSYRVLENLVGARMPKVEHLVPEWGERIVGERVWMADPRRFGGTGYMIVARVDSGRALALCSPDVYAGDSPRVPMSGSWAFVLVPRDASSCRLVVRSRYARPTLVFDAVHFLMEQRMLRRIAQLAAG
jgi:hypothetical protein